MRIAPYGLHFLTATVYFRTDLMIPAQQYVISPLAGGDDDPGGKSLPVQYRTIGPAARQTTPKAFCHVVIPGVVSRNWFIRIVVVCGDGALTVGPRGPVSHYLSGSTNSSLTDMRRGVSPCLKAVLSSAVMLSRLAAIP